MDGRWPIILYAPFRSLWPSWAMNHRNISVHIFKGNMLSDSWFPIILKKGTDSHMLSFSFQNLWWRKLSSNSNKQTLGEGGLTCNSPISLSNSAIISSSGVVNTMYLPSGLRGSFDDNPSSSSLPLSSSWLMLSSKIFCWLEKIKRLLKLICYVSFILLKLILVKTSNTEPILITLKIECHLSCRYQSHHLQCCIWNDLTLVLLPE